MRSCGRQDHVDALRPQRGHCPDKTSRAWPAVAASTRHGRPCETRRQADLGCRPVDRIGEIERGVPGDDGHAEAARQGGRIVELARPARRQQHLVGRHAAVARLRLGTLQRGAVDAGVPTRNAYSSIVLGGVGLGRASRLCGRRIRASMLAGNRRAAVPYGRQLPAPDVAWPCRPRAKGRTRMSMLQTKRSAVALLFVGLLAWRGGLAARRSQQAPQPAPSPAADPAEPQQMPRRVAIRFLTDSDYPPFNYYDEDNVLTGFNVDVARAICLELAAACDIQVRPWPELLPALRRGEADAVIASHAVSANALKAVDFTDRYYHTPARFAGKRSAGRLDVTPEGLEGKKIAVAKGTAHEAYLRTFFRDSSIRAFEIAGACARRAHQRRRRPAVRRRHQPRLLAQRHGLQGLLRVQGRAVRRAQVLRRRRGDRRQPRGPAAQAAHQRGAEAPARERPLRGAAAALLPLACVLMGVHCRPRIAGLHRELTDRASPRNLHRNSRGPTIN